MTSSISAVKVIREFVPASVTLKPTFCDKSVFVKIKSFKFFSDFRIVLKLSQDKIPQGMELLEVDVPVVILVRQTDQGLGLTLRHHPAQLLDQLDQLLRGDQSVLVVVKQTEGLSGIGQRGREGLCAVPP